MGERARWGWKRNRLPIQLGKSLADFLILRGVLPSYMPSSTAGCRTRVLLLRGLLLSNARLFESFHVCLIIRIVSPPLDNSNRSNSAQLIELSFLRPIIRIFLPLLDYSNRLPSARIFESFSLRLSIRIIFT